MNSIISGQAGHCGLYYPIGLKKYVKLKLNTISQPYSPFCILLAMEILLTFFHVLMQLSQKELE